MREYFSKKINTPLLFIKVLWAPLDKVQKLSAISDEVKYVLVHNVPESVDPEDFGAMMCEHISEQEIVSIRPMKRDWLIRFASQQAAYTVFTRFNSIFIKDSIITTEWVTNSRLQQIAQFADFVFELRCLCLANYWDPPIFIYGRIIPYTKTQLCSVIIKNNRKNSYTTFILEMCYEGLADIHSRVCEVLLLLILELKELPMRNVVIKCTNSTAIVGEYSIIICFSLLLLKLFLQLAQSLTWNFRS